MCLSYGLHFSGLDTFSWLLKTVAGEDLAVIISDITVKSHVSVWYIPLTFLLCCLYLTLSCPNHDTLLWDVVYSLRPDAGPCRHLLEDEKIFESEHLAWGGGHKMRGSDSKQRVTGADLAGQKPRSMFYQIWSSTVGFSPFRWLDTWEDLGNVMHWARRKLRCPSKPNSLCVIVTLF